MNKFFQKETLKPKMRPHAVYFKHVCFNVLFSSGERSQGKVNAIKKEIYKISNFLSPFNMQVRMLKEKLLKYCFQALFFPILKNFLVSYLGSS